MKMKYDGVLQMYVVENPGPPDEKRLAFMRWLVQHERLATRVEDDETALEEPPAPVVVTRTVTVPGCVDHAGLHLVAITLRWVCPTCGGPRGEPFLAVAFDGSRRLVVHAWRNPCGHSDSYHTVRAEAGLTLCRPYAHG